MKIRINRLLTSAILVLLILSGCVLLRDPSTRPATPSEIDSYQSAIDTNNVSRCFSLDPRASKAEPFFSYEPTFDLRNSCFYIIASKLKDPQLCDNLIDVEKQGDDFNYVIEACKEKAS
jgi:hypothetical protein